MSHRNSYFLFIVAAAAALAVASCDERTPVPRAETARPCDASGARQVVAQLGERMKRVSLQAPDSIVVREIRQEYAPLVTPDLLEAWISEPARAPGRKVSSPWPERIEVYSVEAAGTGLCWVRGAVVYVTSVELASGGAASREPVVVSVKSDDGWRINAYEAAVPPPIDSTGVGAREAPMRSAATT